MPSTGSRRAKLAVASLLVAALAGSSLSTATADEKDDLKDDRSNVDENINQAEAALQESSARLVRTSKAYDTAKADLGQARDTLATTQAQLKVARAYDETMRVRLQEAEQELKSAVSELGAGREKVSNAKEKAQQFLIDQATDGEPGLRALSSLLKGESSSEFGVRMDYTSAVNEAQTASLDDFNASAVMLELRRDRVRKARNAVATERKEAAENLDLKQQLEKQAEQKTTEVEGLVSRTATARSAAEEAKQGDLEQIDKLEGERDRIGAKLRQIAETERQAQLRQERREQRQQNENNGGNNSGSNGNNGSNGNSGSNGNNGNDGNSGGSPDTGFSLGYPVPASYITSPYGMRLHPVLGIYKLHDGTDFSAGCGTPVTASESGTVTEAYYNAGYGNRIILSHGYHDGASIATSYNHMTSFSVGVGQQVSKGDVIGYSGTTGYSTGCHMHFMVYSNGATADPMGYL